MSNLLKMHDDILTVSLEDPTLTGQKITFENIDGSIKFDLYGSVNIISRHLNSEIDDVEAVRANCTVRHTSLAVKCGYPDNPNWRDNLPDVGWIVSTTKTQQNIPCVFVIEKSSVFPDYQLPMVTYFLAEIEIAESAG